MKSFVKSGTAAGAAEARRAVVAAGGFDGVAGGVYRSWENVYGGWSFFNFNDFTGAHRPNVNGYSDTLDAISTHALSGRTAKDEAYRAMLEAAMSEVGASDARPSFGVDVVRLGRPQAPQETESSIDEAGEIDDDRIQQL